MIWTSARPAWFCFPINLVPYPHLAITSGKNGHIYLLNRDSLGGYGDGVQSNPQVVQEVSGQLRQQMGTPAYWNGRLYFGAGISPHKDAIKAFAFAMECAVSDARFAKCGHLLISRAAR